MHATQPQGGACPDPTGAPDNQLVALLLDPDRFRLNIAQQMSAHTAQQPATPTPTSDAEAEGDGYVVTDAGIRVLTNLVGQGEAPGTAAQVLRNAAVYLERHGWNQGSYYDLTATRFTPAADMAGAIAMVCYGGPVEAPAQHFDDPGFLDWEEAVLHLDRWLLVNDGSEAYEFNDAKGRRIEDVLHALRQAAATPSHELLDALRAANQATAALPGGDAE